MESAVEAKNGRLFVLNGVLTPPSILPVLPHRCDITETKTTKVRSKAAPSLRILSVPLLSKHFLASLASCWGGWGLGPCVVPGALLPLTELAVMSSVCDISQFVRRYLRSETPPDPTFIFMFQGQCVSCSKVKLSQCSSGVYTVRRRTQAVDEHNLIT